MADLVLPAASSFERDVVLNGRGGMFFLSEKAIEPVGEAKNDIEIMIGMLRAMQLHDEALEHGYEKYMEYILEPSGVTLEELRAHPEGVKGRVIIPPAFKRYEKKAFIHHPVRWNLYHRYSNVTKTATDIPDFRNTEISVRCQAWTGKHIH